MKRILIGEDDIDLAQMISRKLHFEGFSSIIAHEGIRIIEMAHKEKPDLIILDLVMPAGTGDDVLTSLKSHNDTRHIPIIIMTGHVEANLDKELKELGADDFILKPCEPQILVQKIQALLPQ